MSHRIRNKTIDLNELRERLDDASFAALGRTLTSKTYPIILETFPQVSEDYFLGKVLAFDSHDSLIRKLHLLIDEETDRVIGFVAVRAFGVEVDGVSYMVTTGSAYVLEAYRGRGHVSRFFLQHGMLCWWKSLLMGAKLVAFSLCSPSAYHVFSKQARVLYPSHDAEMTEPVARLYERIQRTAGYRSLPGRPLVVGGDRMWLRSQSTHLTASWRTRTEAHIKYYLEICGDYLQGSCVMTLVPVDLANLSHAAGITLKDMFKSLLARFLPRRAPVPSHQ